MRALTFCSHDKNAAYGVFTQPSSNGGAGESRAGRPGVADPHPFLDTGRNQAAQKRRARGPGSSQLGDHVSSVARRSEDNQTNEYR